MATHCWAMVDVVITCIGLWRWMLVELSACLFGLVRKSLPWMLILPIVVFKSLHVPVRVNDMVYS